MDLFVLSSGSCGNCAFVRSGATRIIVDAGIPARSIKRLLATIGESIDAIDGVLITHDHRDHIRSAELLSRRPGLSIYATEPTLAAAAHLFPEIDSKRIEHFAGGDRFSVGSIEIESVPTPHDAADPVGFVVDDGDKRLGIFTDFGHAFDGIKERIATFDAVMIESNYDEEMLEAGPYPDYLKERIGGPLGHLSNHEAARLLRDHATDRLRTAILSHLSAENNDPASALATFDQVLDGRRENDFELLVARRGMPMKKLVV